MNDSIGLPRIEEQLKALKAQQDDAGRVVQRTEGAMQVLLVWRNELLSAQPALVPETPAPPAPEATIEPGATGSV